MVLWVDKYRPHSLSKCELHADVSLRLQVLVGGSDFPHLLFYGPSGSGKKTRINAVLREVFGSGAEKVRVLSKAVKLRSKSKTVEVATLQSNYHIELSPAEAGNNDRQVIQEIIRELAQSTNVASSVLAMATAGAGGQAGGAASSSSSASGQQQPLFKVVVLNEVDRLSMAAQQALRRTMEKYTYTCRLILVCESLSKVIPPLRSRCLPVRVAAPKVEDIQSILQHIAKKEDIVLHDALALQIAQDSGRNLRKAILMLEACSAKHPEMRLDDAGVQPRRADWENFIDFVGRLIVQEQSPDRLLLVRSKLYELLTNCIPPDIIMKTLVSVLLRRVDDEIKVEVIHWAAYYDHRMHLGSKPIFHLEAFIARYKKFIVESFG